MNVIQQVSPQAAPRADTQSGSTSGLPSSEGLNNMFLQLLVAQLQNQSPLNPMDPTQFVGQLAQFSELSEVTQIEQILRQAVPTKSDTLTGTQPSAHILPDHHTAFPAPLTSAAVRAAQASVPMPTASATSILNSKTQGVF